MQGAQAAFVGGRGRGFEQAREPFGRGVRGAFHLFQLGWREVQHHADQLEHLLALLDLVDLDVADDEVLDDLSLDAKKAESWNQWSAAKVRSKGVGLLFDVAFADLDRFVGSLIDRFDQGVLGAD